MEFEDWFRFCSDFFNEMRARIRLHAKPMLDARCQETQFRTAFAFGLMLRDLHEFIGRYKISTDEYLKATLPIHGTAVLKNGARLTHFPKLGALDKDAYQAALESDPVLAKLESDWQRLNKRRNEARKDFQSPTTALRWTAPKS